MNFQLKCVFFMLLTLVTCFSKKIVPTYTLNLDLEPEIRWVEITKNYSKFAEPIRNLIKEIIPPKYIMVAESVISIFHLQNYFPHEYASELVGVARGLNLTLPEVFLINIVYESRVLCTSIVARNENGTILHGRNLDYDFPSFLKQLTANVEFMRKGKLVFKSTGWIGQVGFFTAMKPNKFTVTLNQRDNQSILVALLEAILDRKAKTASVFIRQVVETASSFTEAVNIFSEAHLVASLYFIVGGITQDEGVIITRGQYTIKNVYYLNDTQYGWFLVQTNYDHWLNPPSWDDRRHPAIKHMLKIGLQQFSLEGMNEVLSTPPVLAKDTIYTALMSARYPNYYFAYEHD